MSTPGPTAPIPPIPAGDDGLPDADGQLDATREDADGNVVLDPDANDDLVDSADADVIASGGDDA